MTIKLGEEDYTKYPFLEEAGVYFKKREMSLEDISQPDYIDVIERAKERVIQSIKSGEVSSEISKGQIELLSFPISLMLVKATNLDHLIPRYSLAESIRVEKLLKKEGEELVIHIFKNTLKIDLIPVDSKNSYPIFNYKIKIIDYLKRAIHFHELQWKLVNRVVYQGNVYLTKNELIRLIRKEIENMIRERLKALPIPKLPPNLNKIVEIISAISPPPRKLINMPKIIPDNYPPCVKTALNMLKKGENLSHYGRFLLTTYLLNIGSSIEDILSLFSRSPDFNEKLSKYQIEHLSGIRGGHVKYITPQCRTLITHDFCFKTKDCKEIINPLQFGRNNIQSTKWKNNKKWTKKHY